MFEQISQETHPLFASLEKMRTMDVLIYGAGVSGERVLHWLSQQGIHPIGFLVDRAYNPGASYCALPVTVIEDYFAARNTAEKAFVIVAFEGYDEQRFLPYRDMAELLCCELTSMFILGTVNNMPYSYVQENRTGLEWLASELQDETSKRHLLDFINQKVAGTYRTDYDPSHYFSPELMRFGRGETYVDCGAYDGDTVLKFAAALREQGIDGYESIVAFEPDEKNQEQFRKNTHALPNVRLVCGGAWSEDTVLCFQDSAKTSSQLNAEGTQRVPVHSIDSILNGAPATFIKMDIEGAELGALKGAQETIRRHRPKLAISVYHKKEDLFTIPEYIKSLVPDYRLYLRKHAPSATELVLYALPDGRDKSETE